MLTSIVINNYNYSEFLEEAILSALNQEIASVEVIVVDDGSTDDSRSIIEAYKDRIIPILKSNGGQASAFNEGFEACSGEIICFLDSDDYFYPGKVLEICDLLRQYPEAGWCFHELEEVDKAGQVTHRPRHRIDKFEYVELKETLLRGEPLRHWFPATSGLCFRRQTLEKILPMPETFKVSADAFVRLASLYLHPGVLSPSFWAVHRQHGNNLYEFRSDVHIERAKIGIKSAYYLREKFPEICNFTNQQFCFSVGKLIEYTAASTALDMSEVRRYAQQETSLFFRAKMIAYIIKAHVKKLPLSR